MSVAPGTTIGPYRLDAELGRGGMGVVYLARDTRLDRAVAIKALPEHLAADPDRLARFEREAKTLATLNHPNVAGIHGVEEHEGARYLVLEFVDGETLAERLDRGPLPVDEAIEVCAQIAAGVEAAHEAGVIHRDLKPGNIILTPEGRAKVLDFGLAKAAEAQSGSSVDQTHTPTMTTPASPHMPTAQGAILGTAAYMSPEQARGRRVDKRTDIWSFGVVLYEMLTGANPFMGETVSDSIGAVLHKEVDLDRVPDGAPPGTRHVLTRCLARDRRDRYRDIGDAAFDLTHDWRVAMTPSQPTVRRSRAPVVVTAALALTVLVLGLMQLSARPATESATVTRLSIAPADGQQVSATATPAVAISPDGQFIVYTGGGLANPRLLLRRIDAWISTPIDGTERALDPAISPDGRRISFVADRELKVVSVGGGSPTLVTRIADDPRGHSWATDDSFVLTPNTGSPLARVGLSNEERVWLTELDADRIERTHRWPQALPGGKAAIFTVGRLDSPDNYEEARIDAVDFATGRRVTLVDTASMARYAPSGHLVFHRGGDLFAAPFDIERLALTGPAVPVVFDVLSTRSSGAAHFAISQSGTLVYIPGTQTLASGRLSWIDEHNVRHDLEVEPGAYRNPVISPNGEILAVSIGHGRGEDIWTYDLRRGTFTRLTFRGNNINPVWAPDGSMVAFSSARDGNSVDIYTTKPDGTGEATLLHADPDQLQPESWAPDGKSLVYSVVTLEGDSDLWTLELDGSKSARPILDGQGEDWKSAISPDGEWLAYQSDQGGRYQVYVTSYPEARGRWQVSRDGGVEPKWSADGSGLYFREGGRILKAEVSTDGGFRAFTPQVAFAGIQIPVTDEMWSYAVSPEGDRVYVVSPGDDAAREREIRVVLNWASELTRESPAGGASR